MFEEDKLTVFKLDNNYFFATESDSRIQINIYIRLIYNFLSLMSLLALKITPIIRQQTKSFWGISNLIHDALFNKYQLKMLLSIKSNNNS